MTHTCPVCSFDGMREAPTDHAICPCCGTQFGYHDAGRTHAELRQQWVNGGMHWHSRRQAAPPGWDPAAQLRRVELLAAA